MISERQIVPHTEETFAFGQTSGSPGAEASGSSNLATATGLPPHIDPAIGMPLTPKTINRSFRRCSRLDEIETLPPNSQVLAANELSAIQAIATQTPWRGSFLGTQYHF